MEYSVFKLIHIAAVMMFMGNIITGLFWMSFAVKTKDLKIINHTMKSIIRLDKYFTLPGVVIIVAGGILAAIYGHLPILRTGWILWSLILFSISGLAFMLKLAPLQKKIYEFTLDKEGASDFDWTTFNKMHRSWDIWGLIATATPLGAFIMMVLKIPQ